MIKALVAGDIYSGSLTAPLLARGDVSGVIHGLTETFRSADLRLANLEGPLVSRPSPIPKIGPVHAMPEASVAGLKAIGFDVLNLANNHIMDHGLGGLRTTRRLCSEYGIECVGAGETLEEAGRVLVRDIKGVRVGFYSCTEHEFGVATRSSGGSNPLDPVRFSRAVAASRNTWDHLIVLLHGGNEYYPYPRPELRELCRFMIEQGASAVISQHSHCAGCYESHGNGVIVHGQGNFIFDERSNRDCEQEGFLAELEFDGSNVRMRCVPFFQSSSRPGPDVDAKRAVRFLQELEERSVAATRDGFVEQQWAEYCASNRDRYLGLAQGYHRRVRQLDQRLGFLRYFRSEKRMRMLLHLFRCESHREVLIGSLTMALEKSDQTNS